MGRIDGIGIIDESEEDEGARGRGRCCDDVLDPPLGLGLELGVVLRSHLLGQLCVEPEAAAASLRSVARVGGGGRSGESTLSKRTLEQKSPSFLQPALSRTHT